MNIDHMKERFNTIAMQYDEQRKMFIPCLEDYYGMSIDFLSGIIPAPLSVLDLGAGTGLLTKYIFNYFPDAEYTLIDISEEMLKIAEDRFKGNRNFSYIIDDYSRCMPDRKFDVICSALSIHHLENEEKQNLYNRIFDMLTSSGCLINLDQFNPASAIMNDHYNRYWYEFIRKNGIVDDEYDRWLKRRELDRENTIDETITMLKKSGFTVAECIYQYMKFGVVIGLKTGHQYKHRD